MLSLKLLGIITLVEENCTMVENEFHVFSVDKLQQFSLVAYSNILQKFKKFSFMCFINFLNLWPCCNQMVANNMFLLFSMCKRRVNNFSSIKTQSESSHNYLLSFDDSLLKIGGILEEECHVIQTDCI